MYHIITNNNNNNKMSENKSILPYIYGAGVATMIIGQFMYSGYKYSRAYRRGDIFVNKRTGEHIKCSSEAQAISLGYNSDIDSKIIHGVFWPVSLFMLGVTKAIEKS
jgi:hypothetical protein